jgi:hypothetical protein
LPGQADITVLWASATPIKQAVALSRLGREESLSDEARRTIETSESNYVLEVYGIPAIVAHGGAQLIQTEIHQSASLRTKTDRVIRPESVYTRIQGDKLVITMRFPRTEPITTRDRWVECSAKTGIFEFNRRFHLSQMVFQGKLEL